MMLCRPVPVDQSSRCRYAPRTWLLTRGRKLVPKIAVSHQNGTSSSNGASKLEKLHTKLAIIGSGPAAHTAAIYAGRAELSPLMFEGFMANGIAPGGQLTTTHFVENFPGQPEPILGIDLMEGCRKQTLRYGARIFTETVNRVEFGRTPFRLFTDTKEVTADAVIVATGASAKRLRFPGADQYWNNGISACAICDGASPLVRNHPVAVIGGGDAAMEEALFLTKYASTVYIIHRFDYFEASRVMQRRALTNPKIRVVWHSEVTEALGNADTGLLTGVRVRDNTTREMSEIAVNGLFFAIGHKPATNFLGGQLELDDMGYIVCPPGECTTSVPGVFAAGDVKEHRYRQAIYAAGSGCQAALQAEHFLQALAQAHHERTHTQTGSMGSGGDSDHEPSPSLAEAGGSAAAVGKH
mmetsp:Transcript_254/g.589  ORF Transcript_254/g.589 Transcript_254/m.589 type:complete len:411 (-) Transcript_254:923-2155(-)|eukprot:CAMPEP_0202865548 /NCGR_PEP_ID=MMETSP1391-20130828/6223_1 /ASSEMBLY_ACC=CAM_ASM_000867 /TAXON_ID=1034604 /ORGANISM="Chlamydomonas leiostraca, Strain SAG 11-49" /LENGTH=410 /DNA_ID=CAMNT_0049545407 /DNA_START=81 /DNA_END=1313 /DNA_ORIENTATION=+